MSALIVLSGKHKGKKISLPASEVIIGRGEDCFIRLASEEVSRHHCSLILTSRGLRVRDLKSQNGTMVNTVRMVGDTLLQPGDTLQIGPIEFQIAGPRPKPQPDLDDDIAGWLTDGDTDAEIPIADHDTTIVKASQLHAAPPPPTEPSTASHSAEPRKFATVAEEARDIIRRHLEKHPPK